MEPASGADSSAISPFPLAASAGGAAPAGCAPGAAGSDAAIETADIALMSDDLEKLAWLVKHSRSTLNIIKQNVVFSLAIKGIFVGLTFANKSTLWMAILADMGASFIVVSNGLRLLKNKHVSERQANATITHIPGPPGEKAPMLYGFPKNQTSVPRLLQASTNGELARASNTTIHLPKASNGCKDEKCKTACQGPGTQQQAGASSLVQFTQSQRRSGEAQNVVPIIQPKLQQAELENPKKACCGGGACK